MHWRGCDAGEMLPSNFLLRIYAEEFGALLCVDRYSLRLEGKFLRKVAAQAELMAGYLAAGAE